MTSMYCPSCQRVTGHKRALGWATFFAVTLTIGVWFLALPFYKQRCVICGMLPAEMPTRPRSEEGTVRTIADDMAKTGRYRASITLAITGVLVAGILLLVWLAPK